MIIITGASDGVGKELAKLYQQTGKTVVNVSRRACDFADVNLLHDLCEGAEIHQAAQEILALEEPLEAVINCIGAYSDDTFGDIHEADVQKIMATNVKAPLMLISELTERITRDEADILNVISTAGVRGAKRNPVYVASKWAERGFTQSLQDAFKETPCRVVSFCPGGIDTELFSKAEADVDTTGWMNPVAVAGFIKQILDLPKNMQVTEIILDRKQPFVKPV